MAQRVESASPPYTSGKLKDVRPKAMSERTTWLGMEWSEGIYR